MQKTPKGLRVQIGLFGRRNVGKSSLLNAVTRQATSIVSDTAGTTTDPVEKAMEMLPIGPVLFIDTAGIDDDGALGAQRVEKTRRTFDRADVAVIVAVADQWGAFEESLLAEFSGRGTPVMVLFNKADIVQPGAGPTAELDRRRILWAGTNALEEASRYTFRELLLRVLPEEAMRQPSIIGDLVPPGELAVLVVPIDLEAPKGRLILPQVQTIRDLLDHDSCCMVVKERELRDALDRLKRPPALVTTDSQAFLKVVGDTPADVRMTSFSILFARAKGDLNSFVAGARAIDRLKRGDRILIAEGCSHHPIGEDIGRVKIPRWLTQYVGGKLEFAHCQGLDFPEHLGDYQLVVHCGSCTFNRRLLLSRIMHCRRAGVPITNYGVAIAYSLGIMERALSPFPAALDIWRAGENRTSIPGDENHEE